MVKLSRRELQCLRLAGQDLGNKDIAARLGIAPSTVENHLTNAYAKLGTSDRRSAAALAARDYPDYPRFAPTPMAPPAQSALAPAASGEDLADGGRSTTAPWFLPPPPRRPVWIIGAILAFAALGGVITAGLVQLAAGGVSTLSTVAPPGAVLTLDSKQPAGKRP